MAKNLTSVYVCTACGKISSDNINGITPGWDISCTMNSIRCYKEYLTFENGRVVDIPKKAVIKD